MFYIIFRDERNNQLENLLKAKRKNKNKFFIDDKSDKDSTFLINKIKFCIRNILKNIELNFSYINKANSTDKLFSALFYHLNEIGENSEIYDQIPIKWYAQYIKYDNDTVYINICTTQNNFNENIDVYVKLIIHELLHAYEDYNRIKNTGQGIFAYYNEKYKKSFAHLNSQNDIKRQLSRCNYFLNDQERNAYLSQIETDIESIFKNEHIKIEDFNYTEFKDKLKNTDIWKEYFKLSTFILKLKNSECSNEQKQYVEDIWNQLYNKKKTFNQINKELYNNWQKFEKKFEQLVPKIICRYIETNLKEVAFDICLLDEEKYWENII